MASPCEIRSSQWITMKKQIVMNEDTPFLPQEIIRSILKRLPVKSLIRFQCVCKEWKNLFKSPSFIEEHHHHSINQNPSLLLQQNRKGDPFHLYLLDREMQVREFVNVIDPLLCISIIGSSNGLLCVEIGMQGISPPSLLLWNPAIKKVRKVPRTIDDFKGDCYLGFGFSRIVNDYKIVRIFVPWIYDENGKSSWDNFVDRVEVYSLCTGSWKEVDLWNLDDLRPCPGGVTADGSMYWCGLRVSVEDEDEDDSCDWIISFDIAMEVFELIPMPDIGPRAFFELAVYENKLAIPSQTWSGSCESFLIDLWVMEEGVGASGERWTWTKKYAISFYTGFLFPFCFQRNEMVGHINKVPGFNCKDECEDENEVMNVLSMLNLNTKELKNFDISKCVNQYSAIFNYAESLVPVSNTHIEEPRS